MGSETGKRVLVTGADGFIGSHLTEMLLQQGHRVVALSQYNSFNHWGWLEQIVANDQLEVITGDVRDANYCREITRNIDRVYHLAALIAIPFSYTAPDSYIDTNIKGTLNLCQACRDNGVERLVHTSTSEVYGTAQYVPIDEKHPLQPQSPYSASKIGADALAMSFHHAFGLGVSIARPFNTYGPRQSARAVIPTVITQIAAGARTMKLGDMRPTRDFNYVKDTCRGLIAISESEETIGRTINIGSGSEISIGDLVETISRLMNADLELEQDEERLRPENSEVFRLCCDNTLIRKYAGYEPQYDLNKGLTETIEWFLNKENLRHYKSHIYNV
ncbi:MAG: NAD dependent epimerase/dehydratase [Parasphingorhabdus sp.]|jgi:NAD dependent epimerase/dehydratase